MFTIYSVLSKTVVSSLISHYIFSGIGSESSGEASSFVWVILLSKLWQFVVVCTMTRGGGGEGKCRKSWESRNSRLEIGDWVMSAVRAATLMTACAGNSVRPNVHAHAHTHKHTHYSARTSSGKGQQLTLARGPSNSYGIDLAGGTTLPDVNLKE